MMHFPKKDQKDTIIYNSKIVLQNIPPRAYDYIVNGKSAIEWVMERYAVTVHKESGIRNDWAAEVETSSIARPHSVTVFAGQRPAAA